MKKVFKLFAVFSAIAMVTILSSCSGGDRVFITEFSGSVSEFNEKYNGEFCYYVYNNKTVDVTITDVNPDMETLGNIISNNHTIFINLDLSGCTELKVIPERFIKYSGAEKFKSIILPDCVEEIGAYAFYYLTNFTTFPLPLNLKILNECCLPKSITSVNMPDSVTTINEKAFNYYGDLKEVKFSDNIKYLPGSSFSYCPIKELILPANLEKMDSYAFSACVDIETIVFNSKLKEIPQFSFIKLSKLKNVTIPEGVEKIGYGAFDYDTALETIYIPSSVSLISTNPFYGCSNLSKITVSSENTNYKENEDYGYLVYLHSEDSSDLVSYPSGRKDKKVVVDDKITTVQNRSFSSAKNLEEIVFGKKANYYEQFQFNYCTNLKKIRFTNTTYIHSASAERFLFYPEDDVPFTEITISIPKGYSSLYKDFLDKNIAYYKDIVTITVIEE